MVPMVRMMVPFRTFRLLFATGCVGVGGTMFQEILRIDFLKLDFRKKLGISNRSFQFPGSVRGKLPHSVMPALLALPETRFLAERLVFSLWGDGAGIISIS